MGNALPPVFDFLMLRNRLFSLRNVQMWAVPSWKISRFADSQESRFQALKFSNMGSAVLVGARSADIHELCFQTAKRSDMECADLQGGQLADAQEEVFQGTKRWNIGSAVQQWGWFADAQESYFQAAESSEICSDVPQGDLISWCSGIAYTVCETFRYGLCRHERTSICWYSVIEFWILETFTYGFAVLLCGRFAGAQDSRIQDANRSKRGVLSALYNLLMLRNRFSGCELFKCGPWRHERTSICWFSGIAFSGFETFKYG